MPTYAQLNTALQSQCGAQLRTFDKTVGNSITAYVGVYGPDTAARNGDLSLYIALGDTAKMDAQDGPQGTQTVNTRFEYTNAADSLYANYLDTGIATGDRIYSQDVIDSISDVMERTVNLLKGRIANRTINAKICHSSCHSSCHTSRGRR